MAQKPKAKKANKRPDPRAGQMRPRGQRSWRDETNPFGSTSPAEEAGPAAPTESEATPAGPVAEDKALASGQVEETSSTSGPGGGGKTEWPGRAKQHQGVRGGPSRKP
jgi:hypothetical protein